MPNASEKLIRIGIECESIEGATWGISRVILKLLEELTRRPELRDQYRFRLFFKSRIPDLPVLNDPLFEKEVIWQPFSRHSFVLYYYVFLPIRLWFAKLDAMYYPSYMLPIIHPPFLPALVLLTDDLWYEMRSPEQRFHHKLAYRVFGTWATWRATRIMAISRSSASEIERLFHIPQRRIAVNELAVDALRAPQGVTRTAPYLLYVGQAFPRRNLRETLLAFERIAPQHPNLQLVCVGPDKYIPPIKEQVIAEINARLKRQAIVSFEHVSDSDLAALYANATALVYVSSREGFGLPPLEALAYGTPPVVADTPITREIYGTHAFFVPMPVTPESIAPVLERALSDATAREEIRSAAPDILSRYTWSAHTDRFIHITASL